MGSSKLWTIKPSPVTVINIPVTLQNRVAGKNTSINSSGLLVLDYSDFIIVQRDSGDTQSVELIILINLNTHVIIN